VGIVLVAQLVGLLGLIVPVFPGLVVIWLADLGYGLVAGFGLSGWICFAIITLLMLAGSLADNVLMGAKARVGGASWWTLAAGWVAGVAGCLLLPPLGGIPASLLAVFIVEWIRRKDWRSALELTRGTAIGCGWAFVLRVALGLGMLLAWGAWVWIH
jgi:uncharacterized protein YqgC (DUF456 family)